jgi:hypothetical protein
MGKKEATPRPAYRQALEAIGWYFDQQLYRGIFVAEVAEGYIGKARPAEEDAELRGEGFTFPHDDVAALITGMPEGSKAIEAGPPLCPGGYYLLMRAVGEMCDRVGASYVSVLEMTNGFVLSFSTQSKDGRGLERRRHLLDRSGVENLLTKAGI